MNTKERMVSGSSKLLIFLATIWCIVHKRVASESVMPDPAALTNDSRYEIEPEIAAAEYELQRRYLEAEDLCRKNVISRPYPDDGRLYCEPFMDDWGGCWNYTAAGETNYINCPTVVMTEFDSTLTAFRICTTNGTWWTHPMTNSPWANYTTCIDVEKLKIKRGIIYLYVAGYSISMVALLISLVIFFYFKQLKCDRITIHKNLFISYIVNGLVWILYYLQVALNEDVLTNNPVWCQVLHVITQYFVTSNFSWMFCEGLYLHTIIVFAFTSGKTLIICCYVIGWVVPIITSVLYAVVRALDENASGECWLHEVSYQWIMFGPIAVSLLLNLFFLCNIVRVLITKLIARDVNSPDTNQTRKATRAILILIPLLGLQNILFPLRPEEDSDAEVAYLVVNACITSFQGLFVAMIFCFFNGEVISVIKRKWGQHQLMRTGSRAARGTYHTTVTQADPASTTVTPKGSPPRYSSLNNAPPKCTTYNNSRSSHPTGQSPYMYSSAYNQQGSPRPPERKRLELKKDKGKNGRKRGSKDSAEYYSTV